MSKVRTACYIGIGSNLGDARGNVQRAIIRLGQLPETRLDAHSNLFRTAPVDAGGDDYINAVARVDTGLSVSEMLHALQQLELEFGRERPFRNAPRTLDLDILLYGQQTIKTEKLTVPHPRLTQRAFALIPLLQLDPLLTIPGQGPAHSFVPGVAGQAIQKI
ncbi:2-amino-4-hydroxy-6-hydroxymethyldihydropteridine diphosphokinase [Noviherbaspirillum agri]